MPRAVGAHPRRYRLTASVFKGFSHILTIASLMEKFHSAKLHIVCPVVLFVNIGRHYRHGLAGSGLIYS